MKSLAKKLFELMEEPFSLRGLFIEEKCIVPETKPAESKRVYCMQCRHHVGLSYITCRHPDNLTVIHTPAMKYHNTIKTIEELNANNDCKWYKKITTGQTNYAGPM